MNRRGFLQAILAAGVAPAVVGSGVLMLCRGIIVPPMSGKLMLNTIFPITTIEMARFDELQREMNCFAAYMQEVCGINGRFYEGTVWQS